MDFSFLRFVVLIAARHSGLGYFEGYRRIEVELQGMTLVFNVVYSPRDSKRALKVKTFSYYL